MNLHIEITNEQHDDLVRLLSAIEAQYKNDAAALLRLPECGQAEDLAAERLADASSAETLIDLLANY